MPTVTTTDGDELPQRVARPVPGPFRPIWTETDAELMRRVAHGLTNLQLCGQAHNPESLCPICQLEQE